MSEGQANVVAGGEVRQKGAILSLVLLLGLNLLNYADRSTLFAVQRFMRPELTSPNDTEAEAKAKMGLLVTAFVFTYLITAPVFGLVADRWRRWWIVGLGVLGGGLASAGSGWAQGFGWVLVMRALVGLSEAAYGPAAPTLISDLFPARRRGGALAWFYMAIPVGTALGYVYGGWMNTHFGWRAAFHWLLAPAVALGLICFFMREPARGGVDGVPARKAKWADYKIMLATPSFIYTCVGMTLLTFALGGMQAWVPEFFGQRMQPLMPGKSPEQVNDAASTITGGIIVVTGLTATIGGGYLADRLRRRWSGAYLGMSGLAMLVSFPFFLGAIYLPIIPSLWSLGAACFFLFLNTGPSNTALANVTHPAVRSSAFALNIFVVHALGDALSPPLLGYIAGKSSFQTAFLVVGLAIVASGIVWLIGSKHLAKDTELAPTRLAP